MQETGANGQAGALGFWREERWRLAVLAIALAVVAGIGFGLARTSRVNGTLDSATHSSLKRKEEVGKRFKEGVAMLQAQQYEYALTAFHRVLQLAPEMPEAHVNAGFALLGLGQPKAARDFFDVATNLRPNQFNAYFGLAEALSQLGDDFGAMQAMETYLHLSPGDDPFRRQAQSAVWELRSKLEVARTQAAWEAAPKEKQP